MNNMVLARHGSGIVPTVQAYGSQVHPVFMLPALAASWFGSILALQFSVGIGLLHMIGVFCAIYTAHLKDGYVDFYLRDEDDDHPLTPQGCIVGIGASLVIFLVVLYGLWLYVDLWAALLTLPTWILGYLHAPYLDMNTITATAGYPTGISLAIVGGYYTQTQLLSVVPLSYAGVFLILICGVKIIDDLQDYKYDKSICKRTVAVVLGPKSAWRLAYLLLGVGILTVIVLAIVGVFPPSTIGAGIAFAVIAGMAAGTSQPKFATMLLIRGSYVFFALLIISVWYKPLKIIL